MKKEMNNEIIFYTTPDGNKKVEVVLQDETAWLTQKAIAGLFDVQRPAITKHLGNIFSSGELVEESVSSILEHTAGDGKNYKTNYPILEDKGKVSAIEARLKAEQEFEIYRKRQDAEYISDFDREIRRIEGKHE